MKATTWIVALFLALPLASQRADAQDQPKTPEEQIAELLRKCGDLEKNYQKALLRAVTAESAMKKMEAQAQEIANVDRLQKRCAELEKKHREALARAEAAEGEVARLTANQAPPPRTPEPPPQESVPPSAEDIVFGLETSINLASNDHDELLLTVSGTVTNQGTSIAHRVLVQVSYKGLRGRGDGTLKKESDGGSAETVIEELRPGETRPYFVTTRVREKDSDVRQFRWEVDGLRVGVKLE